MGIDTKILLTNPPEITDLLRFADEQYEDAALKASLPQSLLWLSFKDGKDNRSLAVFPPGECASDYADVHTGPAILMSMGYWGNAEAIARRFTVKFGGMFMLNDCDGEWQTSGCPATPDSAKGGADG